MTQLQETTSSHIQIIFPLLSPRHLHLHGAKEMDMRHPWLVPTAPNDPHPSSVDVGQFDTDNFEPSFDKTQFSKVLGGVLGLLSFSALCQGFYLFVKRYECLRTNQHVKSAFSSRVGPVLFSVGLLLVVVCNFLWA